MTDPLSLPVVDRLPEAYRFLAEETGPPELIEALKLLGVEEIPGPEHSPEIMKWERELAGRYPRLGWIEEVIKGDETPWCGLFMANVTHKAGHGEPHQRFLSARSWANWGVEAPDGPQLGDTAVYWRGSPESRFGHVGIYVGEDRTHDHVLGGNQDNRVSIMRIDKTRRLAVRMGLGLNMADPGRRRKILMPPTAVKTSRNEA
jgi:uncharacterized protein (TIGR02594 family)